MPLNDALRLLIQQKNKENAEIQQKAKVLLKKVKQADTYVEEETISIVPENNYRKQYVAREIDYAQKEMLWYTQIERIPITQTYYSESWKKAFARGVRLRTIAELNKPTNEILSFIQKHKKKNPNFDIRFVDSALLVTFALCDDKEVSLSTEKMTGLSNSQMLSTNNAQLIKVIKDYFELRWSTAMTEYPKKE